MASNWANEKSPYETLGNFLLLLFIPLVVFVKNFDWINGTNTVVIESGIFLVCCLLTDWKLFFHLFFVSMKTELERDADDEQIKSSYRRLAKFYHPDGLLLAQVNQLCSLKFRTND